MNEEQIRKDFEEWMGYGGLSLRAIERNSKGDYILMQAASAWHVWKAVYAHYAKPAAPVELPEPVMAQVRFKPENDTAWSRWKVCAVEDAREIEAYTLVNGWDYEVRYLYTEQQVHALLAQANCTKSQTTTQEPFGYFKCDAYGWMYCAETDEGARPLYEAPQPQADALDSERWRFIKRKLCLTGNGDGTCAMQALNLPARILGWPDVGELAIAQFLDAAIDAAIAAAKEKP